MMKFFLALVCMIGIEACGNEPRTEVTSNISIDSFVFVRKDDTQVIFKKMTVGNASICWVIVQYPSTATSTIKIDCEEFTSIKNTK